MQIHKYKVLKRPNLCYIFEKRIVQGYKKLYSHESNTQIQKYTNTQIHKYTYTQIQSGLPEKRPGADKDDDDDHDGKERVQVVSEW